MFGFYILFFSLLLFFFLLFVLVFVLSFVCIFNISDIEVYLMVCHHTWQHFFLSDT